MIALLAVSLLVAVQVVSAGQTTVIYNDFTDTSALDLNGSAAVVNFGGQNVLRLTPATTSQSGSAFLTPAITLADQASFSTSFTFQITNSGSGGDSDGPGADGIAFVVQTVSSSAGGLGGGIGYAGILNSVAVEFDTYDNGEPDGGNHVGIDLGGSVVSATSVAVTPRFNDGNVWNAWVDYNGVTDVLEVRVAQAAVRPLLPTLSHTVDLVTQLGASDAFVGFTSGTGSFFGDHDIRTWEFINAFNPVGVNAAPDANAGLDQTVAQTAGATQVTLNGAGSTDPDGDTLTYTWTGPFNGGTATGATPTVTFATPGSHTVTLTVNDGNGGTDTDTVVITVAAGATPAPTAAPTAAALPNTLTSPPDASDPAFPVAIGGLVLAAAISVVFQLRRRLSPARR